MTGVVKVYAAINKIQLALSKEGITKGRTNSQQNYKFRGIDDIYNVLSPLLGEHGLCILPRVLGRDCQERVSKAGGALFYVTLEVEFDFVCVEDGSKHVVKTYGEAQDSGDKATNKAMSAAYKYACLQAFAIPTEGDNDSDGSSPDPKPLSAGNKKEPIKRSVSPPAGNNSDGSSGAPKQIDYNKQIRIATNRQELQRVMNAIPAIERKKYLDIFEDKLIEFEDIEKDVRRNSSN